MAFCLLALTVYMAFVSWVIRSAHDLDPNETAGKAAAYLAIAASIALCVLLGVGQMLAAMGDSAGERFMTRTAHLVAVVWVVDAICLLLALGLNSLAPPKNQADRPADREEE